MINKRLLELTWVNFNFLTLPRPLQSDSPSDPANMQPFLNNPSWLTSGKNTSCHPLHLVLSILIYFSLRTGVGGGEVGGAGGSPFLTDLWNIWRFHGLTVLPIAIIPCSPPLLTVIICLNKVSPCFYMTNTQILKWLIRLPLVYSKLHIPNFPPMSLVIPS